MSPFGCLWKHQQEPKEGKPKGVPLKQRAVQKNVRQQSWWSPALGLAKYLPALVVGFVLGMMVQFPGAADAPSGKNRWEQQGSRAKNKALRLRSASIGTNTVNTSTSTADSTELKMVFVVRQDLKMGGGKVAAQCSRDCDGEFSSDFRSDFDAAVGIYSELLSRQRPLLSKWEQCGQPKIVVTCKNQQEMNELRHRAEKAGLPTFTVADAGRTQVAAGSKTVLAIGPGPKELVDSITRHLRLLA